MRECATIQCLMGEAGRQKHSLVKMELLANKNACLLQGRVLVATLHNILLTCCVAIGRRLMTNGLSSLGVQHVSIL